MANPWFDEDFYLADKLAKHNPDEFANVEELKAAIEAAGLTPEQHFELYGAEEGTSPNALFNVEEYLANKAAREEKTVEQVRADFQAAGLSAWAHFLAYGWEEGVNPSNAFDIEAYFADKAELDGKTVEEVKADFKAAGVDPITHATLYAETEGLEIKPAAGGTSTLTEALAALQGAEKAYADYLTNDVATAEVFAEYVEDNNVDVEDAEAVANALSTFFGTGTGTAADVVGKLNIEINDVAAKIDTTRSDDFNNAIIEEERAENTEELTAAQEAVNEVNGLNSAVSAYNSAQAAFQDAIEATGETAADLAGQFARVNSLDNSTTGTAKATAYPTSATAIKALVDAEVVATVVQDGSAAALIQINAQGELVVADRAKEFAGMDQLLAAVKADFDAIKVKDAAEATFQSAIADVLDAENEDGIDLTLDSSTATVNVVDANGDAVTASNDSLTLQVASDGTLRVVDASATPVAGDPVYKVSDIAFDTLTAKDTVTAITVTIDPSAATGEDGTSFEVVSDTNPATVQASGEDLAAKYHDAAGDTTDSGPFDFTADAPLSDRLSNAITAEEEFEKAVQTYLDAKELVDQEDALDTAVTEARAAIEDSEEDGGLGIKLLDLGDNLTTGDDLILFADAKGTTETIANFGASGEDRIYFGSEFELVALGDDEITDRVGASDQLEVFWEQDGSDLVLYVEADAEAGRETVEANLTKIVLTGVSSDDVDFSGGFLTAGEAA